MPLGRKTCFLNEGKPIKPGENEHEWIGGNFDIGGNVSVQLICRSSSINNFLIYYNGIEVGHFDISEYDDDAKVVRGINFHMDEKYRGKGIGDRFLKWLVDMLQERTDIGSITGEAMHDMVPFYFRHGFRKSGVHYHGGRFRMALSLDGPDYFFSINGPHEPLPFYGSCERIPRYTVIEKEIAYDEYNFNIKLRFDKLSGRLFDLTFSRDDRRNCTVKGFTEDVFFMESDFCYQGLIWFVFDTALREMNGAKWWIRNIYYDLEIGGIKEINEALSALLRVGFEIYDMEYKAYKLERKFER